MKTNGRGVVLGKEVEGVYTCIFVAKQSCYALLFGFVNAIEQQCCNFFIFVYQGFGYNKVLNAVGSRVLKSLFAHHVVLHHRVAHLESWVNEYAFKAS